MINEFRSGQTWKIWPSPLSLSLYSTFNKFHYFSSCSTLPSVREQPLLWLINIIKNSNIEETRTCDWSNYEPTRNHVWLEQSWANKKSRILIVFEGECAEAAPRKFFAKKCSFIKKRIRYRYFSVGFVKCFRSHFLAENLRATTSAYSFSKIIKICDFLSQDCSSQKFLPFQYTCTKLYIE